MAQNAATPRITISFVKTPLRKVLSTLSENYQIRFAYSPELIPVHYLVTLSVSNATLAETLDKLVAPLPVSYRFIAGQVVLRPIQKEVPSISTKSPPREIQQQSPLYSDPRQEQLLAAQRRLWQQQLPPIQRSRHTEQINRSSPPEDLRQYQPPPVVVEAPALPVVDTLEPVVDTLTSPGGPLPATDAQPSDSSPAPEASPAPLSRLAQISLLPFLGTNAFKSGKATNNVSVNLLWGTNGGVDGLEIGGIANNIRRDVNGVQIAGLINTVGDDLTGTQVAGLVNIVGDTVYGLQVAGLLNYARQGGAIQAGSLFNLASRDFSGIQAAGLFNFAGRNARTLQFSGLFNISGGTTPLQAATLFNVARDVRFGQLGLLLNVARQVKGLQLGLINVADTVSGVSIGLLNLVAKGYNKVELYVGEGLYGNFSLKIGGKRFYNIFYVGGRTDDRTNSDQVDVTWGLGYGAGTALVLGRRSLINLEAVAIKLNEKAEWTNELHWLGQLRLYFDFRLGRSTSFFLGPTGNLLFSRRVDPETQTLGQSIIVPYTLLDRTENGIRQQGWIGFHSGFRF